ncbi:protein kinase domain-containing protein [Legionella sp. CNM-1927-20]
MHKKDICHIDLKAKNILFDPQDKNMHIIDFGCAEDIKQRYY